MSDSDMDTIRQWVKSSRRLYADFFDWPDKNMKELGIVKSLFESIEAEGFCQFHSPAPLEKDPPDCVAFDQNGLAVGFEVTELVSEKAVRLNKQGTDVYFDWTHAAAVDAVGEILKRKDSKLAGVDRTRYSRVILLIHTDEPVLEYRDYCSLLLNQKFRRVPAVDQAFVLFAHGASFGTRGHVELSFEG